MHNGIDPNAVLAPLQGHLLGQADDARLGGRVSSAEHGRVNGVDGGEIDDGAAAVVLHPARDNLRDDEHAVEIDVGDTAKVLCGLLQQRPHPQDAGVVDQEFRSVAEALHGSLDLLRLRDVRSEGNTVDAFGDRLRFIEFEIEHAHPVAAAGRVIGHAGAEAAGSPRYQRSGQR